MKDLTNAKKWAKETLERGNIQPPVEYCDAAAELILSLPDTVVDGDKLRGMIADWGLRETDLGKQVEALLTPPGPLTMADLGKDERLEHIGKDVLVEGWKVPFTLVAVRGDQGAVLGKSPFHLWPFVDVRPLSGLKLVPEDDFVEELQSTPRESKRT